MATDALPARELRVAIVGSGPAGFFAAQHLFAESDLAVTVDMFERLATPHGLVRAGVAPDHQKIKTVAKAFDVVATRPGFRFFGNVEVGRDISAEELASRYDAVIYSAGASQDRRLGIAGEDLPGCHSAAGFVGWYNAHPDHRHLQVSFDASRAVVVGNGNVALDIARMLVLSPDSLAVTDMADHAVEALRASKVREVMVAGRRGPLEAAFTAPELIELRELPGVDITVDWGSPGLPDLPEDASVHTKRVFEQLVAIGASSAGSAPKRIVLKFLASPLEIQGSRHVESVVLSHNELVTDESGAVRARPTGISEVVETGLVFKAVGYLGQPIAGVPFDPATGRVPNQDGRVLQDGVVAPGWYVAGWLKRGPSGIIGTNKECARDTVASLLQDFRSGMLTGDAPSTGASALLGARGVDVVDFNRWGAIDRHERAAGASQGRPRVKLTNHAEMLALPATG